MLFLELAQFCSEIKLAVALDIVQRLLGRHELGVALLLDGHSHAVDVCCEGLFSPAAYALLRDEVVVDALGQRQFALALLDRLLQSSQSTFWNLTLCK
jgi:hypothetical protein